MKTLTELRPELEEILGECKYLLLRVTPLTDVPGDCNLEYIATMSHAFALLSLMSLIRQLMAQLTPQERAQFLAEEANNDLAALKGAIIGSTKESIN